MIEFQKYISPGLQVGSLGIQEAAKNVQYIEGGVSKRRVSDVDEPVVVETCRSARGLLLSGFSNPDMRAGRLAQGMPIPARGLSWILWCPHRVWQLLHISHWMQTPLMGLQEVDSRVWMIIFLS